MRVVGPILHASRNSRLKAGCTVESPVEVGRTPGRTPGSAAGPLASLPRSHREPRKRRVFIAFGGPQVHADRQNCPRRL
jgi:hypothetical protein